MNWKQVPNALCWVRLALVPVLWALALMQLKTPFAIVLAVAYSTDLFDGLIARRFHAESKFGAKLDTIADNSLTLSMVAWVWLLLPDFVKENAWLIGALVAGFVGSILLQFALHRRRIPLHLWSNKITAWLLAVFLLLAFFDVMWEPYKWVTFGVAFFSVIEELALVTTLPTERLDETLRSAFGGWHGGPSVS